MKGVDLAVESRTTTLPELGDVVVRGMLLSARMRIVAEAETDPGKWITGALSECVLDEQGQPVGTPAEWDQYGQKYYDETIAVYQLVRELLGLDVEELEKNE